MKIFPRKLLCSPAKTHFYVPSFLISLSHSHSSLSILSLLSRSLRENFARVFVRNSCSLKRNKVFVPLVHIEIFCVHNVKLKWNEYNKKILYVSADSFEEIETFYDLYFIIFCERFGSASFILGSLLCGGLECDDTE